MGARGPGAKPVKKRAADVQSPQVGAIEGKTRADRLIDWIGTLTVPSGKHAGRPFTLRPWQRSIVKTVYATDRRGKRAVRLALLTMGRKNGKSGLASALALAHLAGPEAVQGGQVLSGAADRAQAAIIYVAMKAMALLKPDLAERLIFRDFRKEIEDVQTGSIYQALSSDARKAHGLSPNFWIADEVAQWRGRDLLDALNTGMGAHAEPLGFVISTRSADPENPLEELIAYAKDVEAGAVKDASFRSFIYSADPESDPWSIAAWKAANPALGDFRDLDDIRVQAERARRVPALEATFRAYTLNQPVAVDDRWIAPAEWDGCATEAEATGPCFGGLDLAAGPADLSAFALFWPDTGAMRCWAFIPADLIHEKAREDSAPYPLWQAQGHVVGVPGRTTDRAWLGAWIARQVDGLELVAIASDRWLIENLRADLDREGIVLPLEPHGAGFKDVSPSMTAFEALILERRLAHGGNPLLRWAMANAAIEADPAGNRKLSKLRSRGRIDPAVAAITAVGLAAKRPAPADWSFTGTVLA
jgi:phage terminase large subunit-like protein